MSSKFAREGTLFIDHRDSPGLTDGQVHQAGLPVGAGHGVFETPTYTCTHCCRVVVMNPQRTRDRAYCAKCEAWICDWCGAEMAKTGVCRPFARIAEDVLEAGSKPLDLCPKCAKCGKPVLTTEEYAALCYECNRQILNPIPKGP